MNQIVTVSQHDVSDIEKMARAIAGSKLFGIQNPEQALALCLIAQAEGRHPASAAQDYHLIQGKPSKKSDAMLRDFLNSGGKVQWHSLTDELVSATFSHPAGGSVQIDWDMKRAQQAQISTPMWKKYPRQMLRARVVSEGVRTVFPMATSGMYVPEEVQDFAPRDVTPQPEQQAITGPETVEPPPITRETIDRDTGEITTHPKTAETRAIDGEMRKEIDACLSPADLRRLWRTKAFKAEMDKHPADWKDAVTDYANERFAEMEAAARNIQPVKGYQEPDFSHLEPASDDSHLKTRLKMSVALETAAAFLSGALNPVALKNVWDEYVEGQFAGETLERLRAVYEAKLNALGTTISA